MAIESVLYLFFGLLGAIVGSFLNVVILRLPQEEASIVFPGSHCPQCNSPLRWFENVPILSYLLLRGRCGHCQCSISVQYPLVEFLMATLSMAIFYKFSISFATLGFFLLAAALLVIIFIDLYHQIIPDVISLPGIVVGFAFSFFSPTVSWQSSLLGILLGGGVLYTIAFLYVLLRKADGMGGGDIKLLAMIGAWLGWQSLPFVIFASSFTGSIAGITVMLIQKKGSKLRIPFGPFLSSAALIYLFYSEEILYFLNLYITGQWP